jgi:hypothetical protein
MYQAFLKNRFKQQLDLAKRKPAERGETIRVLLESAKWVHGRSVRWPARFRG